MTWTQKTVELRIDEAYQAGFKEAKKQAAAIAHSYAGKSSSTIPAKIAGDINRMEVQ